MFKKATKRYKIILAEHLIARKEYEVIIHKNPYLGLCNLPKYFIFFFVFFVLRLT